MAFGRGDAVLWQAILEVSGNDHALAASPLLVSALSSPERTFRSETAWFLAERWAASAPSAEDRKAALEAIQRGEAGDLHPNDDPIAKVGLSAESRQSPRRSIHSLANAGTGSGNRPPAAAHSSSPNRAGAVPAPPGNEAPCQIRPTGRF
jgi:hypothetical protein